MNRDKNIELLRILAFIMVVSIHITPVGLTLENGIISHSFSWYYVTIVRCLINSAISLFVLISGYVAFYNRKEYSAKKNIMKLLKPLLFYLPVLFLINFMIYGFSVISFKESLINLISLTGPFHHLWYIICYFFIILLTPILIGGIENSKKESFNYVIIFLLLFGLIELLLIVLDIKVFDSIFHNRFIHMLLLYITGFYINKYRITVKSVYLILIFSIFSIVSYLIFLKLNGVGDAINFATIGNDFNILTIVCSVSVFLLFLNVKIRKIPIYYISKNVYGAYLVHTFFIFYIQRFYPFLEYIHQFNYFVHDILFCFLVAICSLLIEAIRQRILNILGVKKA